MNWMAWDLIKNRGTRRNLYSFINIGQMTYISYALLLCNAFEWYTVNIPRVTQLYFLARGFLLDTRGLSECIYQENTSDEWDIPRLYHEKGLHNYFIPCHRKYSGQMGRLGVIQLNCTDRWEGSVEYWRIYNGSSCILIGCIFYGMV